MATIEDYDGTPVFVHSVDGRRYAFSVKGFPEQDRQWLCEVVGDKMDEIHARATEKATRAAQSKIRDALGLKD